MLVPILKTSITFTRTFKAELTFSVAELSEDRIHFLADKDPAELLGGCLPNNVTHEGVIKALLNYLPLRVGLSRENVEVQSFRRSFVFYPNPRDLRFDTKSIEEDTKNGKICGYYVNERELVEEKKNS